MERRAKGIRHFSLDLLWFGHVEARDQQMLLQGWLGSIYTKRYGYMDTWIHFT